MVETVTKVYKANVMNSMYIGWVGRMIFLQSMSFMDVPYSLSPLTCYLFFSFLQSSDLERLLYSLPQM